MIFGVSPWNWPLGEYKIKKYSMLTEINQSKTPYARPKYIPYFFLSAFSVSCLIGLVGCFPFQMLFQD